MKLSTGIVRRMDELGRICLPKEMRKTLNINEKDPIEIEIEGSNIILSKYENRCVFCGRVKPQHDFKEKKICKTCMEDLKNEY